MLMPGIWARRLRGLRPGDGLGAGGREAAPVVHLLTLAIRMSREEPRRHSPRFGDGELDVGGREAARTRLLALAAWASRGGAARATPPAAPARRLAYSTIGWQARSVRPSYSMSATATSTS